MNGRLLRIAHIDTERTWRGGENQVLSLIKGLSSLRHFNLSVVRRNSALSQKLNSLGHPIYEVCPFGEWDFVTAHFLNRKLKAENIDVVHAHSAHGVALAAFATLGTTVPVVVTRRVDFHLSANQFSQWKYRRAKKIIAISQKIKEILIHDGIPDEKLSVVPSGIDFSKFQKVTKASRAEMGVPPDAKVVGQVAALAPHKDQATFLRAIAQLRRQKPEVHAVMVGEGELRKDLERLSTQLGLTEVVHFLGFQEDPLKFLAVFDVFCLSSREEGLGTSILDAFGLRVPVVATRVGGIPELVENNKTGYLAKPQNPDNLTATLLRAFEEVGRNNDILDQAYAKAREFDIQNTISQTEAVYRAVTAESNR